MILSTLALGLFYGLYCLTLRRDRWLQQSLWYLLLTMGFGMVFPFFSLPSSFAPSSLTAIHPGEYLIALDKVDISAAPVSRSLGITEIYLVGLALCMVFLLFQMAAQGVTIIKLRRSHSVYGSDDGYAIPRGATLILLDDNTAPYSFFNQIVVGTRDLSDDGLRCILAHESFHVSKYHSFDLLYGRLMCCLAWFNPFMWLMLRELRAVQEFQADAASIGACGREDYLHLLYRQVTGVGYGHITNNFQSINIKKRIVMMNKTKTRFGAWKAVAALPVVALLLVVGCKTDPVEDTPAEKPQTEVKASVEPVVYDFTQNAPEGMEAPGFPGGTEAFYKYLSENIHYPEQAKADGIQGRVVVGFIVMDDGSIVNVEVQRGIGGGCDEEAVRVVKAMPKWQPAVYNGKPCNVHYSLPVSFKLQ
ncbi:MAG: M56 family metallopeptidase [Bacteroidales bacterium]|nr:M56 family metallopeptidase [Bacteroidales bacterium]